MAETYKNAAAEVTVSDVAVYVCPVATTAIVKAVIFADKDANSATATLKWTDDSTALTYVLGSGFTVPSGTSVNAIDAPVILEPGDSLLVAASLATSIDVTVSVLEIT